MRRNSFNICITLILCVCIIFSYSSVSFASQQYLWTPEDRQTLNSMNSSLSSIYTALSTLYSYLYNNSNGVRELLSYIYTRLGSVTSTLDYYAPRTDTYQNNVWSTINNATYGLLAQGIHLLNIDNDLDTINNSVLAVGGQVADVSSKLLNTNNYLSSIDSKFTTNNNSLSSIDTKLTNINNGITLENVNLSNIHTEAFNTNTKLDTVLGRLSNIDGDTDDIEQILTDIYNSFYFDSISIVEEYLDVYLNNNISVGALNRNEILNYPFDNNYYARYFLSVIPTSAIKNNVLTIIYPYNSLGSFNFNNSSYVCLFDGNTWINKTISYTKEFQDTGNSLIIKLTLSQDVSEYQKICLNFFGSSALQDFSNCTPYYFDNGIVTKSYFELWQDLYGNETFKNFLLSLDNDQIEIILNDIYDHLDQSQVESLLSDIYDKLDESTSIVSTDTDINIEVDLDLDTGNGITSVVNKLKQLYNTGINITSFVTALNFFDNLGWFTDLQDRDLVNSVNSTYINLYD